MAYVEGILAIDTMIGFPSADLRASHAAVFAQTRDRASLEEFEMPVEYMFLDIPEKGYGNEGQKDPVLYTLTEMDRWGKIIKTAGIEPE